MCIIVTWSDISMYRYFGSGHHGGLFDWYLSDRINFLWTFLRSWGHSDIWDFSEMHLEMKSHEGSLVYNIHFIFFQFVVFFSFKLIVTIMRRSYFEVYVQFNQIIYKISAFTCLITRAPRYTKEKFTSNNEGIEFWFFLQYALLKRHVPIMYSYINVPIN